MYFTHNTLTHCTAQHSYFAFVGLWARLAKIKHEKAIGPLFALFTHIHTHTRKSAVKKWRDTNRVQSEKVMIKMATNIAHTCTPHTLAHTHTCTHTLPPHTPHTTGWKQTKVDTTTLAEPLFALFRSFARSFVRQRRQVKYNNKSNASQVCVANAICMYDHSITVIVSFI